MLIKPNRTITKQKVRIMWTRALREERLQAIVYDPFQVESIISENFLQNRETYNGDYTLAIEEFLTLKEAKALLDKLSQCTCCENHQERRPVAFIDIKYPKSQQYEEQRDCKCKCRHFSRWLCRTFGDPVTMELKDV